MTGIASAFMVLDTNFDKFKRAKYSEQGDLTSHDFQIVLCIIMVKYLIHVISNLILETIYANNSSNHSLFKIRTLSDY